MKEFKNYGHCSDCQYKLTGECTDSLRGGCSDWTQMRRRMTTETFLQLAKENSWIVTDYHVVRGGVLYSYKKKEDNNTYYEDCSHK